jgi:hypothetical protein
VHKKLEKTWLLINNLLIIDEQVEKPKHPITKTHILSTQRQNNHFVVAIHSNVSTAIVK